MHLCFAVFVVSALFTTTLQAANGPISPRAVRAGREPAIRTSTELVLITATVLDRDGRLVSDLHRRDFRLAEEGQAQAIADLSVEDAPVSLVFVVDFSGSMKNAIPDLRSAIAQLAKSNKPDDEYMLVSVRDEPTVEIPFSPTTEDIERFVLAQEADGETALIDALVLALHNAKRGRNARRAIVLLSDGHDTASRYSWSELRNLARESNVPIFAFALASYEEDALLDEVSLERVVSDTGGRCVFVKKPNLFAHKLDGLEVHRQYVIGYKPRNRTPDGKYRRVKVFVVDSKQKQLKVFWKRGYFSSPGGPLY